MIIRKMLGDSLLKNSIYLVATNFLNAILGFFFWMVAAKLYLPSDIGMTSAILSSTSLISMISLFGFSSSLIFHLPRDQKNVNRIINSCLMVSILTSTVFSLIFILGINIWTPSLKLVSNNLEIAVIFMLTVIMTTVSTIISGAFMAERRSSFHMIKENAFGFIKIFPLVLFVGIGSMGIFLSWGIGLMLAMIVGFILLYKLFKYSPTFTIDPIIKSMMGYSVGNYIAGLFNNISKLILPIMIIGSISAESAGYFFIAMTMAGLLFGISQSISNALLAESFKGDIWKNVNKSIRFNLALLIPGLLIFIIFGKFILGLFNHSYADHAATTLIILSMASIPLLIINIFNTVRNSQKRVGSTIKINAIVAVTTLVLATPLMKILGIEGAAVAFLIGNIVGAIVVTVGIKNPAEYAIKMTQKNLI